METIASRGRRRRFILSDRVSSVIDASGALLLIAMIAWLLLAAQASQGSASEAVGVLMLTAASYAVARVISRHRDWPVPATIVILAAGFAILRWEILLERPLGAPLGYSNAAGSLYMLAAAAGVMLFVRSGQRAAGAAGIGAAIAFAAVPWLNHTSTAAVLVVLPFLALLVRGTSAVRKVVLAAVGVTGIAYLIVFALGYTYNLGSVPRWIQHSLTERRLMLWHDAINLTIVHPLTGVGPGRFPMNSRTVIADADNLWPHNEMLHFAAEAGLPGFILLVCLVAWAFVRLGVSVKDRGTSVAVACLVAILIHASVDYVLHYPAVPMAAAALVACGVTAGRLPGR